MGLRSRITGLSFHMPLLRRIIGRNNPNIQVWQYGESWIIGLICRVIGHRWSADEYPDRNGLSDAMDYCKRCGRA